MPNSARAPRLPLALTVVIGGALGLGFLVLRSRYRPPLGDGLDGAYYLQIARQVALGHGLQTSYSVFHMALSPLPQRATSYPLLPLLIGYLGRFVSLPVAAVWLPGAAYVLSIGLCYAFLLWVSARALRRAHWLNRALLSAALSAWFGLLPVYVWTSARPYTETLASVLVFASLWCFGLCTTARFRARWQRRAAFIGVGLLAGLCYLARFQLLVVPVALLLSRALHGDRRAPRDCAWLALGAALPIAWQAFRLLTLPGGEVYALIDFARYRQRSHVPPFVYEQQFGDRWSWFIDKLRGLRLSFDPDNLESYLVQLSYLAWVVPFGIAVLILRQLGRTRSGGWSALGCASLRRPRHAALLASAWLGVLAVAPLHTVHSLRWRTWAFGWRQGMPLAYVVIPIVIWLWALDKRALRALLATLIAVSLVVCARKTEEVLARRVPTAPLEAYADVARYLDAHAPTRGTLGMEHQSLAVFTAEPLYWLACWSPPAFAQVLLRELPIERIVLRPGEISCPSLDRIRPQLRVERSFTAHYPLTLYRIERYSTSR